MKFSKAEKYSMVISAIIYLTVVTLIGVLFGFIGEEVEGEEFNPMNFIGITVINVILLPFAGALCDYLRDFFDKQFNKDA